MAMYTLSLHDALPISAGARPPPPRWHAGARWRWGSGPGRRHGDRKSTRLNSSHVKISYAVFCLKKKNEMLTGATRRHLALLYFAWLGMHQRTEDVDRR